MKRSAGVIVLAVFCFVGAFASIALGWFLANFCVGFGSCGDISWPVVALGAFAAFPFVMAGYGLIRLRNWARILTIVLLVLSPVASIFYVIGTPAWGNLMLYHEMESGLATLVSLVVAQLIVVALIVWYLLRRNVREAFNVFAGSPVQAPLERGCS